jgi:hypothetical protein
VGEGAARLRGPFRVPVGLHEPVAGGTDVDDVAAVTVEHRADQVVDPVADLLRTDLDVEVRLDAPVDRGELGAPFGDRCGFGLVVVAVLGGGGFVDLAELALDLGAPREVGAQQLEGGRHCVS